MKLVSQEDTRTGVITHILTITWDDLTRAEFDDFDMAVLRTPHDEARGIEERLMDLQVIARAVERGRK